MLFNILVIKAQGNNIKWDAFSTKTRKLTGEKKMLSAKTLREKQVERGREREKLINFSEVFPGH